MYFILSVIWNLKCSVHIEETSLSTYLPSLTIFSLIIQLSHPVSAISSPSGQLAQQHVPSSTSIIFLLISSKLTPTFTSLLWTSPKHLIPFVTQPCLTSAVVSLSWILCTICWLGTWRTDSMSLNLEECLVRVAGNASKPCSQK